MNKLLRIYRDLQIILVLNSFTTSEFLIELSSLESIDPDFEDLCKSLSDCNYSNSEVKTHNESTLDPIYST